MLLAGLIAGALYNPWTGPQTRDWLMDKVAGDDDLQPLESYDIPVRQTRATDGDVGAAADRDRDGGRRELSYRS